MSASEAIERLPVTTLRGVGEQLAKRLEKYNIHTLQDILFHLPLRYLDRTRITPLADVRHGDYAVIEGEIMSTQVKYGHKRQLVLQVHDANGTIEIKFFYFNKSQQQQLAKGNCIRAFGEVRLWNKGFSMVHPEYRIVKDDILPVEEKLTPIYPTTEGISQKKWQQLTEQTVGLLQRQQALTDFLPATILQQYHFPTLLEALSFVHRPPPDVDQELLRSGKHVALQRLAFEELLAQRLSLLRLRQTLQSHHAATFTIDEALADKFLSALPFALTIAQQRVLHEIHHDLTLSRPMLRLVQGDVGSGKTVVAALAALQVVMQGYQVAIMAPTELLAEQHLQSFTQWLAPFSICIGWLSSSIPAKQRRSTLENITLGLDQVIIGTHALFQTEMEFKQLGLVVIDEQHRFGVHQRLALRNKGKQAEYYPHQLIMTATPIPRTLAMTAYADLDTSLIDELPPGRIPIQTAIVNNQRRGEIVDRVRALCQAGEQVYWVCPLIEESETLQCQAAEVTAKELTEQLPTLKIGLIHGRLSYKEKETIMQTFKEGQLHLLVATTIIEVGVNVPNASLMIIENAERLGLAQLHQLRGRVGRGNRASHCLLLYQMPLSAIAKERLAIMRETTDGFKIAEKDLAIRGPGEVLGTRQTGVQQFKIADIIRDQSLLTTVKQVASEIITNDEIVAGLIQRWVGDKEHYVNV